MPDEPSRGPAVVVIGIGNPLRGDDGAGIIAAEAILARELLGGVEVVIQQQLTPELALVIEPARLVLFIDADLEGPPGSIKIQRVRPRPSSDPLLGHHQDPAATLAWCESLYGTAPQGLLFTISGSKFEMGDEMSLPVQRAVGRLADRLAPRLRRWSE
ncbi:hydrogenase maturation protease [Kolteria novifilia]